MKVEFSRQIFENIQNSNFIKIFLVGAELFQAYGQTDMTKLAVAFCFLRSQLETEKCTQFGTSEIAVFGNRTVGPRWHIWQSCIYLASIAVPPLLAYILFLSTCKLII